MFCERVARTSSSRGRGRDETLMPLSQPFQMEWRCSSWLQDSKFSLGESHSLKSVTSSHQNRCCSGPTIAIPSQHFSYLANTVSLQGGVGNVGRNMLGWGNILEWGEYVGMGVGGHIRDETSPMARCSNILWVGLEWYWFIMRMASKDAHFSSDFPLFFPEISSKFNATMMIAMTNPVCMTSRQAENASPSYKAHVHDTEVLSFQALQAWDSFCKAP